MSKNKPQQIHLDDLVDNITGQVLPHAINDFLKEVRPTPVIDWGPSMTKQEFKDECDINVIMATYEASGIINHQSGAQPQYVDLTSMPPDYQTALAILADATASFMTLPATVRREFNNDPQEFVAFASDPENLSQMQTWGLAPPTPAAVSPAASPAPPDPLPASVEKGEKSAK